MLIVTLKQALHVNKVTSYREDILPPAAIFRIKILFPLFLPLLVVPEVHGNHAQEKVAVTFLHLVRMRTDITVTAYTASGRVCYVSHEMKMAVCLLREVSSFAWPNGKLQCHYQYLLSQI